MKQISIKKYQKKLQKNEILSGSLLHRPCREKVDRQKFRVFGEAGSDVEFWWERAEKIQEENTGVPIFYNFNLDVNNFSFFRIVLFALIRVYSNEIDAYLNRLFFSWI